MRDVIHLFNQKGLAALDPSWAGGRPRLISDDDIDIIRGGHHPAGEAGPAVHALVPAQARRLFSLARPASEGLGDAAADPACPRHQLPAHEDLEGVHRPGPGRQAGPDRACCHAFPGSRRCRSRPCHGSWRWARQKSPPGWARPANRTHSVRYFHGCYCVGDDQLWGILPPPQGCRSHPCRAQVHTGRRSLAATGCSSSWTTCRRTRPRRSGAGPGRANVELCFTPVNASWANPIPVIRAGTHVCHARLRLPQPHRTGPQAAGLPALAQCQCPPPRRPGRPASRTGPGSQRTPAPPGPAESQSSTTNTVNVCGQRTKPIET